MRTTVRLPDDLLRAAKQRAHETGRTLTRLLEDSLRAELRQPTGARRVSEPLPTYRGAGPRPGVDLTDASALEDLMTGR